LTLAAGLTAFALVVLGAVFGGSTIAQAISPAAPADAASTADVAAQAQQQETAYRQLIDQANQQLQQAYDQIAQLQGGVATDAPALAPYPISADLAAGLAVSLAPGAQVMRWPTLVDFQGTVAYEIILDRGTMYIDATTGRLLFSNAAQVANASVGGSFGGEAGEHEDDD
jgi:hypothetical protein